MIQRIVSSLTKDGLMIAFGGGMLGAFLFVTYASVYVTVANPDVVNILIGQVSTMVGGIVGYYFGSSKSSADKTRIMADKIDPVDPKFSQR